MCLWLMGAEWGSGSGMIFEFQFSISTFLMYFRGSCLGNIISGNNL